MYRKYYYPFSVMGNDIHKDVFLSLIENLSFLKFNFEFPSIIKSLSELAISQTLTKQQMYDISLIFLYIY